jgi:hypothetical protein
MPIVFSGVDLAQKAGSIAGSVAVMGAAIAVAGAVVRSIHGIVLVVLSQSRVKGLSSMTY